MPQPIESSSFKLTKRLLKRALLTALVVGSIINGINYTDVILLGEIPSIWKMCLTYMVPFCVTIWGAYSAHSQ